MHLAVTGDVFDGDFLCCFIFPRDVLDEIWDLIESVPEGLPTYVFRKRQFDMAICIKWSESMQFEGCVIDRYIMKKLKFLYNI